MPLSSNTLIHFTKSKESLLGILQDNFKIFYCKESIQLDQKKLALAVPMVSFCDIPLSEIKDHISKYGNYGIGITKEWGKKMKLNPVLYFSSESSLSVSYKIAHNNLLNRSSNNTVRPDDQNPEQRALLDVARYIKNYEADLTRNGNTINNYRFSDEREWRYVPPHSDAPRMLLNGALLDNEDDKKNTNNHLKDLRLKFEPNDIKYIIINDDSEISEFINHLKNAKGKNYYYHDVERLTTRIITSEQIKSDI
jgi:Putative abortive phage resistance protein AbiGi, antitoxin